MSIPIKWKKYLLLANYGLTTLDKLNSEIHRYRWKDFPIVVEELRQKFSVQQGDSNLFVVKLVSANAVGQLPNFRLTLPTQLPNLMRFLQETPQHNFEEVWYCETQIDVSLLSVAGRLAFYDGFDGPQILEQVWRCSPRLIETMTHGNKEGFNWPYVRATRPAWAWRFCVEELYCPRNSEQGETAIRQEMWNTMHLLERAREQLGIFATDLVSAGVSSFSFEYKIIGNSLWFIDWDTTDDAKVMRRFHDMPVLS